MISLATKRYLLERVFQGLLEKCTFENPRCSQQQQHGNQWNGQTRDHCQHAVERESSQQEQQEAKYGCRYSYVFP